MENHKSRMKAAELKCFRKTSKYALFDHKRNQDIMIKLKIQPVLGKIQ
jgi:hypothetical protein